MAINLDALSHAELQALIENAEAQMAATRKNRVHEVRAKIDALLQNAGLTLDEVYPRRGGKGATGVKSTVAPKY
ncbi:MAG: H-NS histone family protein, partial [Alphaproteobacteria bacterium]|nr:H-NS histone family protein [Alphaproteobacteria bacterium]